MGLERVERLEERKEKPINEVRKMANPGSESTNAETRDREGAKLVREYQHYHWRNLKL